MNRERICAIALTLGLLFVALVNLAVLSDSLGNSLHDAATLIGALIARFA